MVGSPAAGRARPAPAAERVARRRAAPESACASRRTQRTRRERAASPVNAAGCLRRRARPIFLLAARGPRSRRAPVQSGFSDPWQQLTWQRSTSDPARSCRHLHGTKRGPSHRAAGASQHTDHERSSGLVTRPDTDKLSAFDPDGRSHPIGLGVTGAHQEAPHSAWANEKADETPASLANR
jgi:hypothetical protein